MEQQSVIWGIVGCYIRPGDGNEYQIQAAQESTITSKAVIEKLMGDDSLVPLDVQPKSKDITVAIKNGKVSQKVEILMMGGTNVSNAAASLTTPEQESVDSSMASAITASLIGGQSANLRSDTYTFFAGAGNTYQIIRSSDGLSIFSGTAAAYPINGVIPGVTFTVSGTLVLGSTASITTVALGETVEIADQAKNDFASKVGLRVITEAPSESKGESAGQFEWLFPNCQPEGLTWPVKTKSYAIMEGNFTPLYDTTIGKIAIVRKYSRQAS